MQTQPEARRRRVAAHDAVGKGWIANGEVETASEAAAGVILAMDARFGVEQPCNARGDRIVLDPGQAR
jgi:hypothetical protein